MIRTKRTLRIVIGSLDIGGTEKHLAQVLPGLIEKGWKIRLLTLKAGGILEEFIKSKGIQVLSPSPLPGLRKFPKLLRKLISLPSFLMFLLSDFKRHPLDITHFFLPEAYILGMIAALGARNSAPKLMSRRSLNTYQTRYPASRWLEKYFHHSLSAILANSLKVLNQLHEEEVPEEKLRLIYNGVDLKAFDHQPSRKETLKSLGISQNAFVMIIVANLIPYKGHKDLLEALALISPKLPANWHLLCVGHPLRLEAKFKEQASASGLANHILWLGLREDIPALLKASNLGILCSHQEGFANAILEGMAASLPMVVTNVGGNAEAVIDNQTGYVVAPHEPKALAEAILRLACSPETAKTFGQAGYKRVKEKFTLETCLEAYHQLYKEFS